MRNLKKKGFTIVELVIVIAVIAVLAAVLIPTFVNLTRKANVSADTVLVKNLNTSLSSDAKEHKTMHDALEAAKANGYDIAKINAKAEGNKILWDSKNDCFVYLDTEKDELIYIPNTKVEETKEYDLWIISNEIHPKYSTYLYGYNGSSVETSKGIDTSDAPTVTSVTYTNTGDAQKVVIRTVGGALTVNAPQDDVSHYGKVESVNIKAVKSSSYHEFGNASGNIVISKGNLSMEQGSSAAAIIVDLSVVSSDSTSKVSVNTNNAKDIPVIVNKTEADSLANVELNIGTNDLIDTGVSGVAVIKNVGYATLQEAIDAAQNGDTIVLLDNIIMASGDYLMVTKAITLNMNEKIITGESNSLIYVTSNSNLTIRGNGTIENQQPSLFNVSANSVLTIYDGNYSADADVIYVDGSLVNVYGGSFTASNTTNYKKWEIVYLKNAASANIYGGTFITPKDGCYGIVLYDASEVNLGKLGEEGPTINTWRPCVSTNGSESNTVTINIYSGTFKANRNDTTIDDQNVIQLANAATSEIQTLNIYGGYFEQTSHLENSCIFTLKYSGMIKLNIMGGTFNYGNNSKLFCGYGKDSSGYPSASNIKVNVQNDIIPKNVTIEVYGSGVVHIPERDFVVNQ